MAISDGKLPKIITVTNQKGGVGKTTTVVTLAQAFSAAKKKVLVVDLDFQGNATNWLGLGEKARNGRGIAEAITGDLTFAKIVLETDDKNISVVASNVDKLLEVKRNLTNTSKQYRIVKMLLDDPKLAQYDVVLIDTHPDIDAFLESALAYSDFYLVPVFAEQHPFDGLELLNKTIQQVKRDWNPKLKMLGIMINQYDKTNETHREMALKFAKHAKASGVHLFDPYVPISKRISRSVHKKQSIWVQNANSPIAKAFASVSKEILQMLDEPKKKSPVKTIGRTNSQSKGADL